MIAAVGDMKSSQRSRGLKPAARGRQTPADQLGSAAPGGAGFVLTGISTRGSRRGLASVVRRGRTQGGRVSELLGQQWCTGQRKSLNKIEEFVYRVDGMKPPVRFWRTHATQRALLAHRWHSVRACLYNGMAALRLAMGPDVSGLLGDGDDGEVCVGDAAHGLEVVGFGLDATGRAFQRDDEVIPVLVEWHME